MDLLVNDNLFGLNFLVHRGKNKSVSFRIVQDMQYGQKLWHIKGRLSGKLFVEVPEIIEVVDPLVPDTFQYCPLSTVIGSKDRCPVPEDLM